MVSRKMIKTRKWKIECQTFRSKVYLLITLRANEIKKALVKIHFFKHSDNNYPILLLGIVFPALASSLFTLMIAGTVFPAFNVDN